MNKQEYLLTTLSEECSEVIKELSKALRFGLYACEPGSIITNSEKIQHELGDLIGVMQMIIDEGYIGNIDLGVILSKKEKVIKYMGYSRDIGTLKD